jgi:prepilin-type N-terminal cleavage/methylation domain-containing protein
MSKLSKRDSATNQYVRGARVRTGERGYSMIEVMVVVGIGAVLSAVAIPMVGSTLSNFRLGGDAHSVSNAVALTKMRAAATFTRARLFVDRTSNTFHIEEWNNTTGAWVVDGGTTTLSSGVQFGFGPVTAAPPNTQAIIDQAPACLDTASPAHAIGNTACVLFNSRGIPIDGATANPTTLDALYVTDGNAVYGTTVAATGTMRLWLGRYSTTPSWTQQ